MSLRTTNPIRRWLTWMVMGKWKSSIPPMTVACMLSGLIKPSMEIGHIQSISRVRDFIALLQNRSSLTWMIMGMLR